MIAARYGRSRPCWEWCGWPAPGTCGGHPASRHAERPAFPCLACRQPIAACEAYKRGSLCCSRLCAAAWAARTAADARAIVDLLGPEALEWWEERAAILDADDVAHPDTQALLDFVRARLGYAQSCPICGRSADSFAERSRLLEFAGADKATADREALLEHVSRCRRTRPEAG